MKSLQAFDDRRFTMDPVLAPAYLKHIGLPVDAKSLLIGDNGQGEMTLTYQYVGTRTNFWAWEKFGPTDAQQEMLEDGETVDGVIVPGQGFVERLAGQRITCGMWYDHTNLVDGKWNSVCITVDKKEKRITISLCQETP